VQQLPLFDLPSNWTPPEVLPDWENADAICIDTETREEDLERLGPAWPWRGGHVAGYAVGLVQGDRTATYYLPIGHREGGNLDASLVRRYIDDIARSQIPKIFHNAVYDIGWMWADGAEVLRGPLHDTQVGAALIDENRLSYSLDNLAKDYLGTSKDEKHLREAAAVWGHKSNKAVKSNMWRLPARHVGPYAEGDVRATVALWRWQQARLAEEDLMELYRLEMEMVPLLFEMRKRGIRVDLEAAEKARDQIVGYEKDIHREIKSKWGVTVDVWTAGSIARVFDKLGLTYPYTPKSGEPSFTKEFLEGHTHEFPKLVRELRKLGKTVNTFIDGQIGNHSHNGRIHTELHQSKSDDGGTVSGRLSCSNPNLQQNTGRDARLAPIVRGLFLPEPGELWAAHDYSSQEPRLTLHYAFLTSQLGAAEAVEMFRRDPHTDYHQMVADICAIGRKQAKPINLGLPYGMGDAKLCHDLGLPTKWMIKIEDKWVEQDDISTMYPCYEIAGPEGKAILEQYHERLPYMKGLMNTTSNLAGSRGYIKTILNRRCRFDSWEPTYGRGWTPVRSREEAEKMGEKHKAWKRVKRAFTHKALNRLIQGSAADQTKKAMVMMYKEGIIPMMQMHDELDISTGSEKETRIVQEIMIEAVKLEVPIIVDSEYGSNWGNAKHTYADAASLKAHP
jgi:DNA polymerase I-like protein with 3'-5' exonuclease and polymerase domains